MVSSRWSRLLAVGVAVMVWAPVPAMASRHTNDPAADLQQRLLGWVFGSATDPITKPGFCGEMVGGEFFLNVALAPDTAANCVVPRGASLVGTPGGALVAVPTDAATPAELPALIAGDQGLSDPAAVLDGESLAGAIRFARPGVYTIPVAKHAFLRDIDPNFPVGLKRTSVASMGWTIRVAPLSKGRHTLVLSDKIDGAPYTITFTIRVR